MGMYPVEMCNSNMKVNNLMGHTMFPFFTLCRSKRSKALLIACLVITVAYGQATTSPGSVADNLNKGFEEVSNTFVDIYDYLTYACWTAAAAVAVVGGFTVFSKYSNGDQDAKKYLVGFIFGIILLAIIPSVVKVIFFQ